MKGDMFSGGLSEDRILPTSRTKLTDFRLLPLDLEAAKICPSWAPFLGFALVSASLLVSLATHTELAWFLLWALFVLVKRIGSLEKYGKWFSVPNIFQREQILQKALLWKPKTTCPPPKKTFPRHQQKSGIMGVEHWRNFDREPFPVSKPIWELGFSEK